VPEELQLPERLECAECKARAPDAAARERETKERILWGLLEMLGALVGVHLTRRDRGLHPADIPKGNGCMASDRTAELAANQGGSRTSSAVCSEAVYAAKETLGETVPDAASYFRFDRTGPRVSGRG
jgi:hypothetical protein